MYYFLQDTYLCLSLIFLMYLLCLNLLSVKVVISSFLLCVLTINKVFLWFEIAGKYSLILNLPLYKCIIMHSRHAQLMNMFTVDAQPWTKHGPNKRALCIMYMETRNTLKIISIFTNEKVVFNVLVVFTALFLWCVWLELVILGKYCVQWKI